jgi:hypothetical protein
MLGHPVSNSIFGLPGNATSQMLRCRCELSYRRRRHDHGRIVSFPVTTILPPTPPPPPLRVFGKFSLFISFFSHDFGPYIFYAVPTLTIRMSYGEYGEGFNATGNNDQFSILP